MKIVLMISMTRVLNKRMVMENKVIVLKEFKNRDEYDWNLEGSTMHPL